MFYHRMMEKNLLTMMMHRVGYIGLFLGVICACSNNAKTEDVFSLVNTWSGREIVFPARLPPFRFNKDSVCDQSLDGFLYKIVSYVDSSDCLSCKARLYAWNAFREDLKNRSLPSVPLFMFFCPKNQDKDELNRLIRENNFECFSYLDFSDSLNKLNHFPSDINYQTFLLDKDNKVLAIGNPVLNPKVKDLYLRIIRGESPQAPSDAGTPVTTVSVSSTEADLGTFPWQEPRTCTFTLRNTGDRPLVIHDVTTSCGCLTVDYPEEPARPGEELTLRAHYRADSRGTVLKSMQVYCNAQGSPLRLRVTGTAE